MAITATSSKQLQVMPVTVTSQVPTGEAATNPGADTAGNPNKYATVHSWTVNSQAVKVLVRVQVANGRLWVDMVSDVSVANLVTVMASIDLSTVAPGHPSPTVDATDTSALTAAA